jgi:hypothetical protein
MLNNFKENFFGGTRANRFRINGSFPTGGGFTNFHVRATQVPSVSSKTISYDYFGRKYHYPGEKDYGTWSFQAWDDTGDNNIWGQIQRWQDLINNHDTNVSAINADAYKAYNWSIQHLNINGEDGAKPILKEFILHGCWPAGIQQVSLNMSNPNQLNSFNVIVVFDYIEIRNVTQRN